MSVTTKVLQRGERPINYQAVKRIKIIENRKMYLGIDKNGQGVDGTLGDEFNIPEDLSRESATSLLKSCFAEVISDDASFLKKIFKH